MHLLACAALLGCAPTPSAKPLGWGPLLPGMQGAPAEHHRTASKQKTKPAKARAGEKPALPQTEEPAAATSATPEAPSAPPSKDAHPADAKSKVTAAAFVGDYTGEDVATYRIEGMPDRTEKDPKARLTVTSSSDTALAFELVDSSNGKEICTLKGTLADGTVAIGKGQKCFEQNAEQASAAATVVSGTATVDKTRLVFDLDMSFSMEVADRKLGGSLAYHFDGTRK